MWFPNSFRIPFRGNDIAITWTSILYYWMLHMNEINLPLKFLSQGPIWSSCDRPSSDHLHFSHGLHRTIPLFLFVVVIRFFFCPWLRLIVFLYKILNLPSLNQFLNLFLQTVTLISVMVMIFVEATILLWISSFWGLNGFNHFKVGSPFIYIIIFSTGISKGVKFNFFFDASRLLLLTLLSEELSLQSLFLLFKSVLSSFFHLPIHPFTVKASSRFIYFWALNNRSLIEVGGVFPKEKMKSGLFILA